MSSLSDNKTGSEVRGEPEHVEPGVGPFRLLPDNKLDSACSISDLLQYHDRTFVLNAYATIAKRHPEEDEFAQTLDELRGGVRTKRQIIEDPCAKHPDVKIDGLSSPSLRNLSRWPVVGYLLRVLRAISQLPVLIQHQQQFESYIVGQQQRMADYVNDALTAKKETSTSFPELSENVSDAIKTVMMLSDSLVETLAEGEQRLQQLQIRQENAEAELRTSLVALTAALQKHQEQATNSIQELQIQLEHSETRLHADLVTLTKQVSAHQEQMEEVRQTHQSTATAQREFLIDEQRAIVEAQRAAIIDVQAQFDELSRQHKTRSAELAAELRGLRAMLEEFQQAAPRK